MAVSVLMLVLAMEVVIVVVEMWSVMVWWEVLLSGFEHTCARACVWNTVKYFFLGSLVFLDVFHGFGLKCACCRVGSSWLHCTGVGNGVLHERT